MQRINFDKLMCERFVPPQIYTYPPRKTLNNQGIFNDINSLWNDSRLSNEIGIYIHIPFWKYKCVYCNLYAFEYDNEFIVNMYVNALCTQLMDHMDVLRRRKITTIHFGGGDPLLIGFKYINQIIEVLDSELREWRSELVEFSIESTPLSVIQAAERNNICKLKNLGVNRINIGAPPLGYNNNGIVQRVYEERLTYEAIKILKKFGIKNVSIDLMVGIENETINNWTHTINKICELHPDTVSYLPLTVRSDSHFGKDQNISLMTSNDYYEWYDAGKEILLHYDYKQQNSTRFALETGGNIQEDKHFSLGSILGIGAGARSYNIIADYVINPGIDGVESIKRYIQLRNENKIMDIVYYSSIFPEEELIRKKLILNYGGVSKEELSKINDEELLQKIVENLKELVNSNYYYNKNNMYYFTELGMKYHDLICLIYYSDRSRDSDPELWLSIREDFV